MHLSVVNVAKLLNVSEKSVYKWIQKGDLPAFNVNDSYRINKSELLEWAINNKIEVNPELFNKETDSPTDPLTLLSDALKLGGIHQKVIGKSKDEVLRSVVECLPLPSNAERDFLLRALIAREALGSTAIGNGIAVPHVRNPIVLNVEQPSITLCFLEKPIDFGAVDGIPVGILFTMISTTVRVHLHLLARLTYLLGRENMMQVLNDRSSKEMILNAVCEAELELHSLSQPNI